jgi:hypothetical protein
MSKSEGPFITVKIYRNYTIPGRRCEFGDSSSKSTEGESEMKTRSIVLLRGLFVLAIGLFLYSCASTGTSTGTPGRSIDQSVNFVLARTDQVQIGMSKTDVVSLIGRPSGIKESVTANGTTEQWAYFMEQLAQNLLTSQEQFNLGWGMAARGQRNMPPFIVIFTDGKVSRIEK